MAEGGPVCRLVGPRGTEGPVEGSHWSYKAPVTPDGHSDAGTSGQDLVSPSFSCYLLWFH